MKLRIGVLTTLVLLLSVSTRCKDAAAAQVTVEWTAPADDGADCTTGPATGYDLRYSTAAINEANWAAATKAPGIDTVVPTACGGTEEFVVTGLSPNTTYYMGVRAVDDAGNWSLISNVIQITTPDTVSPAAATDFRRKP